MKDQSKIIFISNDQKTIKEFSLSRSKLFSFVFIFLALFLISGKIGLDLMVDFTHNSTLKRLERTNNMLQTRLSEMQTKIAHLNEQITRITQQDDELRMALGLPDINSDVRKVGIGGAKYDYSDVDEVSGFNDKISVSKQLVELSKLEREVKLELESYQDLVTTFQKKQDSLAYLPAMRPVLKGRITSPFGMRIHPIYHRRIFHEGLDFSSRVGTPVYATADGVVTYTGYNGGYGLMIKIDHKYGFSTRYGHLSKILVRKGQRVKRGEKIAEVGNTGISTAPHLHYEVRLKGKPLNPRLFYFDDEDLNATLVHK